MTSTAVKGNVGETRVVNVKKKQRLTLKIAASAIFAALSIPLFYASTFIPRAPWGVAFFDPISIVWIIAFFIFGYETGLITSTLGMIILMFFDPFTPVGPIMKFAATVPLIIVPWLVNKIRKIESSHEEAMKIKRLIPNWVLALILRLAIMLPLNYVVVIVYVPEFVLPTYTLGFLGLESVTGMEAVLWGTVAINIWQSIADYLIAYAIFRIVESQTTIPW